MTDYEKALMNAIIHQGFDPKLRFTILACETCKNPFMWHLFHRDEQRSEDLRLSFTAMQCPECAGKELTISATYKLPEFTPEKVVISIGHFMSFFSYLQSRMDEVYNDNKPEGHFEKGRWIE